jgi:outer membrane murein-binding lipoprotein Lpp
MKRSLIFATVAVFALMAGCSSSPEEQAAQADADMKAKRMQLADDYQQCTTDAAAYEQAKAAGNANEIAPEKQKTKADCDEIMKTMEALK